MRSRPPLELLVFVVGMATLGSEIAVARLIAPFFGDSTIVWANTIAVVLVALSIGYWFGGRLADRHPHLQGLCVLVLIASVLLAVVPIVAQPLLSLSVDAFDDVSIGGFAGSLFGVLALVSIPVLMLGAVSPWAIRLKLERVEDSGETAGRMYAISTVGSLLGTFSASLLLIPLLGTQRTFLVYAILLALVAALGLGRRWMLAPLAVAALLLLPVGVVKAAEEGRVIHEAETTYQYARVIEYPDGRRQLELNEGQAIHSIWRRDTVLTGNYWDGHLTLPFTLRDTPPRKVAMLGVAGGTVARAYAKYFPDTVIDAVEIDGELFDIGEQYFGLDPRPQLRLHTDDARPYLRKTDERYDFIFLDTYRQPYIPFYLATKEFFELARDRLAPGRRGDHQRRPSGGQLAARARPDRDDGRGVPVRDPRPGAGHEHAADRAARRRRRPSGCATAARAMPPELAQVARADAGRLAPRLRGRRGLHGRPRAGRVARRQVAARLRGRRMSGLADGAARARRRGGRHRGLAGLRDPRRRRARDFERGRRRRASGSGRASTSRATRSASATAAQLVAFGVHDPPADHRSCTCCPPTGAAGIGTRLLALVGGGRARGRHATAAAQAVSEQRRARAIALLAAHGYERRVGLVDVRDRARARAAAAGAPRRLRDPRVRPPARTTASSTTRSSARSREWPDHDGLAVRGLVGDDARTARASSRTCSPSGRARRRRSPGRLLLVEARTTRAGSTSSPSRASTAGAGSAARCSTHAFGADVAARRCGPAALATDSRTGARGLYEHVGMHMRKSYGEYRKPL